MRIFDTIIAALFLVLGLALYFFPNFDLFNDIEFQKLCLSGLFVVVSGLIMRTRKEDKLSKITKEDIEKYVKDSSEKF